MAGKKLIFISTKLQSLSQQRHENAGVFKMSLS